MKIKLLVVNERPLFPGGVTTLVVSRDGEKHVIEKLHESGEAFGLTLSAQNAPKDSNSEKADGTSPQNEAYKVGTLCRVNKFVRLPNDSFHVFVTTIATFEIQSVDTDYEIFEATVKMREEDQESERELAPYYRLLKTTLRELVPQSPLFAFAADVNLANITNASALVNYTCSSIQAPKEFLQALLELTSIKKRCERLLEYLEAEKEVLKMQNDIRNDMVESVKKHNQEQILRQQIGILTEELEKITGNDEGGAGMFQGGQQFGRGAAKQSDIAELSEKFSGMKSRLPKLYQEAVEKELGRLGMTDPSSPEYLLARTYVDTILSLPFAGKRRKPKYRMDNVREVLDRDHYGMKDVKDRILEFLASRSLSGSDAGAIICLVGPPGVGKTSIGRSIAEALGRKYYRFSVGGMRDEAEIKGHRRTYVGALPGKIIKGMLETKDVDPLILIDEIDKIGADYKGDPASALLEVLDPEQNSKFTDLYLDLPYDLSKVLFIVTANSLETIPEALLDRMEIIEVSGYTPREKLQIAENYLVPRLLKKNGLDKYDIRMDEAALLSIAEEYSREAGVRNYEKDLDKIFRKLALRVLEKKDADFNIGKKDVESYLGMPRFDLDEKLTASLPGTAIGLAWTCMGGDVLLIEAEDIPGNGDFKVTGQLGDVMKESCNIALSSVKHEAYLRGMDPAWFKKHSIHLHIPEGATPKDGPSAGITMTVALWSMLTKQVIREDLAMTGELSLTGKVMPIGGLKEKVLAARRNHVKDIIIPEKNIRDLKKLDEDVRGDVAFHPVSSLSEVLEIAFPGDTTKRLSPEELLIKEKEREEKEKKEQKNGN